MKGSHYNMYMKNVEILDSTTGHHCTAASITTKKRNLTVDLTCPPRHRRLDFFYSNTNNFVQDTTIKTFLSEQHICTLFLSSTGTACTRTVMSAARMNQCFVLLSEHSMCNDVQSRRADIIYGSQTEQTGCDE